MQQLQPNSSNPLRNFSLFAECRVNKDACIVADLDLGEGVASDIAGINVSAGYYQYAI